ncbi:tRNA (adenosine(37)-N6)-threonylcarbamoyltransferase complex dimerization subunit type 1 TsaB [Leeia oryzae]|uniref:tRNA (adenosine(37)-N6)-threonylcarbamoyltransferase complex dimerization subunit type 1 TsaB n=1 Tax=Leeia oryzae TaxID=356662 RepID=UPI00039FD1A3|nr:tRNA (adenosine(37)-N6)-threonylcarbamoyltransferase complex dimerization subunit type 1 TsaB [Leeia oryzae]
MGKCDEPIQAFHSEQMADHTVTGCASIPYNAGMRILAIDTSTEQLSISLWNDGIQTGLTETAGQQHSSMTIPLIEKLLADAQLTPTALDAISYPVGPGAFTGLRIGCGIAQGLGFALQRPLIGISTLATLAQSVAGEQPILACLDARMGQVYAGLYQRIDGKLTNLVADHLTNPDMLDISAEFTNIQAVIQAVGNGFKAYQGQFPEPLTERCHVVDDARLPDAHHQAELAVEAYEAGRTCLPHEAGLVYLRDKVALTTKERTGS